ncbi:MAG: hypothetical protein J5965_25835, partial [Aeriscardovia sp.]|nr:hypothetical protein [Aeriscardovia sp.]
SLVEGCEFYSGVLSGHSIEASIEKVYNCKFFSKESAIQYGQYGTISGCTFEGVNTAFYLVFADVIENCEIEAVQGVNDCAIGIVHDCNFNCSKYWMRYYDDPEKSTPGFNIGKINKCTFTGCGSLDYHNSDYCSIKEISECDFVADRIQLYLDTKDMLIKDNTFTFKKSGLCITNDGNGVYTNNLFLPQVSGLGQTIWKNDEAPAPVITSVTRQNGKFVIEGTASDASTIEIFLSDGSQASAVQLVKSLKTNDDYTFKAEVAIKDLKYNYSCFLATATYGGSTSCLSKPVCCEPELTVDGTVVDYTCSNPNSEVNITVKDWTANCVATLNGKSVVPTTENGGIALFVFNDLDGGSYVFEATNEKYKLKASFEFDLTVISYKTVNFKEDNCHKSITISSNSEENVTKEDGRLVLYKMSGDKVVAKSEKYYDLPKDGIFDISSFANGEYRLLFSPSDDVCAEETYIDFKVNNPIPVSMSVGHDSHCEEADGGQDFVIKNWNPNLSGRLYRIDGTASSTTKDNEYVASDNESLIVDEVNPTSTEELEDKTITANYNIRGLGKGTYRFVVSDGCQTWMNRVFKVDVKFEDLLLAIFSIDDCNNFISVKGVEFSDGDYYLIQKVNGEEDPSSAKLLNWTNPEKVVDVKSLASGDYTVKFVPSADNVCSKVSQLDFTASTPEVLSQVTSSPSKCEESNGSVTFSVKNWLTGYHGALYSVDQDFASESKGKETLLKAIEPVDRTYNSADGSFTANFKQENLEAGLYRFAVTDDCGEELLSESFSIEGTDDKSPVIEESVYKVGDNAFMVSILVSDYNPNTKFSYLVQDECNRVDKKLDIDGILNELTSAPGSGVVSNSGLSLSCLNNPVAKGGTAEVIVSMPEEDDFTYSVYDAKGAVVVPETANKAAASFSGNGVSYPVIVKNVNQVLIVRVQTKTDSKSILIIPE